MMDRQPQIMQASRGAPADARMMDREPQSMQPSRGAPPDARRMDREPQSMQPPRGSLHDPRVANQQRHNAQPSRGVQPDPRLIQAQQQAREQFDTAAVPLNDYPMDGMTQFCRIGPPSERASAPSPVRPASRNSSNYSNPNSFSSIEPPSGSASPGKPMAPTPQPEPEVEDKQVQKKKSGFFQNHSPFRRRSKHEKAAPAVTATTPSNRNTWGPISKRGGNENVSPTRPFGNGSRGTTLVDGRSGTPECRSG